MSLLSLIIIREVKSDDIPDEVISDNKKSVIFHRMDKE